jgi:hypothetical protein
VSAGGQPGTDLLDVVLDAAERRRHALLPDHRDPQRAPVGGPQLGFGDDLQSVEAPGALPCGLTRRGRRHNRRQLQAPRAGARVEVGRRHVSLPSKKSPFRDRSR